MKITKKKLLKNVNFAIIKFIVMRIIKNKEDALIFDWYGRDKLFRALNELAGITKNDIMSVIGAKNNKQLTTAFTFPKKCFTIEMIEQFAYLLRNVDGWDVNAILNYINFGLSHALTSNSAIEVAIAKKLYKRAKPQSKFYLQFLYNKEFTEEEIARYKERKNLVKELRPKR